MLSFLPEGILRSSTGILLPSFGAGGVVFAATSFSFCRRSDFSFRSFSRLDSVGAVASPQAVNAPTRTTANPALSLRITPPLNQPLIVLR